MVSLIKGNGCDLSRNQGPCVGTDRAESIFPVYLAGQTEMRSGGTREPPQGEVRKYKAAQVSEGKRGCDCGSIKAFSDDLIYSMSV